MAGATVAVSSDGAAAAGGLVGFACQASGALEVERAE